MTEDQAIIVLQHAVAMTLCAAPQRFDPRARLDDLGIDSHHLAEIVFEIEDELGHELPSRVIDRVGDAETVGDLVRLLASFEYEQA
jgi:acyl carrier protein